MAKTSSNMVPLGSLAPEFSLPDAVSGKLITLNTHPSPKAWVIMFLCNHCPYVHHIIQGLVQLVDDYQKKNICFIGINANDVSQYPDDSPAHMKTFAAQNHYHFPYLFDATQEVAKAYQAACTPDFYVFDADKKLIYRGQLDDARPGNNSPNDGHSIRQALDAVLNHQSIVGIQKPSLGCNIKWKIED